jgi:hypothetical protein
MALNWLIDAVAGTSSPCPALRTWPTSWCTQAVVVGAIPFRRPTTSRVPDMANTAKGTFEIEMTPGPPEIGGAVGRFEFTKNFHGDLEAAGAGVMLSSGNPQAGAAGYVAIETVDGHLGGRRGTFALQQFGTMQNGGQTLHYEVVPGSGHGELEGISGSLELTIDKDGTHSYELRYDLAGPRD